MSSKMDETMKEERSKLVISSKKRKEWDKEVGECFTEVYKRLNGRLLTTAEVALPSGSQVEALKARIKDVQGQTWDTLYQARSRIFARCFSVSDEAQDTKPSEKEYRMQVERFWDDMERMVLANFDHLKRIVVNLTVLTLVESERQQAFKIEIERLFDNSYANLWKWLENQLKRIFEIKVGCGERNK